MSGPNANWKPGDPANLVPPNLGTCVLMVSVGVRCGEPAKAVVTIESPIVRMTGAPACTMHLEEIQGNFPENEVSWTEVA